MRSALCNSLLLMTFTAPLHATAELPSWLAGKWCGQTDDGAVEEWWMPPAGGLMLGLSRTVGPRGTSFEFLRIALADGVATYLAQPRGGAPTAFRQTAAGADWQRFENPAHDFPQRIEYRRHGDALRAEIAGPGAQDKEMVIEFDYRRCEA